MNNIAFAVPNEEMRARLQEVLRATGLPTKESQRAKVARDLRWKFSRVTELSLGRAKPKVEELEKVRQITKQKEKDDALLERLDRIESLLSKLVSTDPDFHEPQIDAHRSVVVRARRSIEGTS